MVNEYGLLRRIKITKKLEELFNMTSDEPEETVAPTLEPELSQEFISQETLSTIERVEAALPQVKGLESSDAELDELSELAKTAFNNLMDLGMQVDPRFSAEIFSGAGTMLGHAITAKTTKLNKKLKMVQLQIQKADLERKIAATDKKDEQPTPLGTGKVLDRNDLLRALMSEAHAKKDSGDK